MMKRPAPVLLLALVLSVAAPPSLRAQRAAPPAPLVLTSTAAEYPPFDVPVQQLEQAGLTAKLAAVRLAQAPDEPDTVTALLARQRVDLAANVARRIVDTHPERIGRLARLLETSRFMVYGAASDKWAEKAVDVIAAARKRLPDLPRAEAAEAAYRLLLLESSLDRKQDAGRLTRLKAFAQEYAGTDAALSAELATISFAPTAEGDAALDAFVRDHPGTCAAAQAIYRKGERVNNITGKAKTDPTDRFLQVLDIVKALESDRYRGCEWAARASDLVAHFVPYQPVYAEGNLDRVMQAYRAFATTRFAIDDVNPTESGVGSMLAGMMARELHKLKGDGTAGIERDLEALAEAAADPFPARYLHAVFLMNQLRSLEAGAEQTATSQKAASLLADVHARATGLYQRKSLATLASLHFFLHDYTKARATYASYVEKYPASPYAWVAAIRIGMCDALAGDWSNAVESYRRAVQAYSAVPPARFVSQAYAARAHEALGEFELASMAYQRAFDGWDNDYGAKFSLRAFEAYIKGGFEMPQDNTEVSREAIGARLAELTRTASAPGGTALERGRWLLQRGQLTQAIAVLDPFPKQFPASANLAEARYLAHKARLAEALDRANTEKPGADEAAALKALDLLAKEPPDFAVTAAKLARACLLANQGKADEGRKVMSAALGEWKARQRVETSSVALSAVERDVAAIREAVVKPTGGAVYGKGRWNAFAWPATLPPFVIVNSRVRVTFPDGSQTPLTVFQRFAQIDNVLLLDDDQIAFFSSLITSLGGTKKREPAAVMETPNQPIGRSLDVARFLNEFFPVRPGHWGGWEVLAYPVVWRIEFVDEARSRARASVTIGYSGADVVMEKVKGVWKAVSLTNQWIT